MTATAEAGILTRPYVLTTVGSWSLAFLAAFESLAVTTVMPVVTADLNGRALYSLAFSATLAASVIGMVVAGSWADRIGPARPLLVAVILFGAGLAIAGFAPVMTVFVTGRFVQGLGAGGITVGLYVLVAKAYPARLHIKIFGAFASAWVLPSIIGPFAAGLVAEALGWRWVFLGVVVLLAAATAMIRPALRGRESTASLQSGSLQSGSPQSGSQSGRVPVAIVLAAAVVALSYCVELGRPWSWLGAAGALMVIGVAARRVIPAGTYRARPGLPAAVLLCGLAGAAFFGTEVYLPLLLHDEYGLPVWLSGITLTAAAISWATASAIQGRLGDRLSSVTALRTGGAVLAAGTTIELFTAGLHLHPGFAAVGWLFAGAGMGTLYPRISTLVLAYSEEGRAGFNTSAKSITDAVGGSTSLAITGLLFLAGTRTPFVAVLVFTSVVAVTVGLLAGRAGRAG